MAEQTWGVKPKKMGNKIPSDGDIGKNQIVTVLGSGGVGMMPMPGGWAEQPPGPLVNMTLNDIRNEGYNPIWVHVQVVHDVVYTPWPTNRITVTIDYAFQSPHDTVPVAIVIVACIVSVVALLSFSRVLAPVVWKLMGVTPEEAESYTESWSKGASIGDMFFGDWGKYIVYGIIGIVVIVIFVATWPYIQLKLFRNRRKY